jgi:carbamate kinase
MAGDASGTAGAWLEPLVPGAAGATSLSRVPRSASQRAERLVVALGGNAIAVDGNARPEAQERAVDRASAQIAGLVDAGYEVVVTHGNGPQVGNLLVKNDLARGVVPPVSLDWCVAQTQATLGFLLVTALEAEFARRGIDRMVAAIVTRVQVDPDDPAWDEPTKPVGRYLSQADAWKRIERGEHWEPSGAKGWRRVVPSPEPLRILDCAAIRHLVDHGAIVVAAGGGGIPMVPGRDHQHGVEAVLDKDRTAALLAESLGADMLLIATDVGGVAVGFGTGEERWLEHTTPDELRALATEGHFAAGSMAPKVEAAAAFVERTGGTSVIGALDRIFEAVEGSTGTIVRPARALT